MVIAGETGNRSRVIKCNKVFMLLLKHNLFFKRIDDIGHGAHSSMKFFKEGVIKEWKTM